MRLPALLAVAATMRAPPAAMLSSSPQQPNLAGLIDEALRLTFEKGESDRQSLVENTVVSWVPTERQRLSDELSDLLSARADGIQKAAIIKHENGEDYSEATKQLEVLVDMTVQMKLLVRRLQAAAAESSDES